MAQAFSRRAFGALVAAATAAGAGGAGRFAQSAPLRSPNIIIINLDDLDTASLPSMPQVQTLLVEQGTTFVNYLVTAPGCTPSRASLLRGQYPHNHGVLRSSGPSGGFQRFFDLGNETSTVGTWLQDAGYRTALVGKYHNHYPGDRAPTYVPPGWDEWYVSTEGEGNRNGRGYHNYTLNENGERVAYGKRAREYSTDVYAAKAAAFVMDAAADAAPFFLYVAPRAPHGPALPAKRHKGTFATVDLPLPAAYDEADVSDKPAWLRGLPLLTPEQEADLDDLRRRLETLQAADDLVAQVIETLEQAGELDRTYLFFTSDNGLHLGEHRLTAGKGTPYEESIRVPLIVRGPGVAAGAVETRLASVIDLGPTCADLAGAALPDFVDGRSIVPLLHGERAPGHWRIALLAEKFRTTDTQATGEKRKASRDDGEDGDQIIPAWNALRRERDIYVEYATGEREFYDLIEDPNEMANLAGSLDMAAIVRLSAHLAALAACAGETCRTAEDAAFDDPATTPPLPIILEPEPDTVVDFTDEVVLRGEAYDASGARLPDERLSWTVRLRARDGAEDLLAAAAGSAHRLTLPAQRAVKGRAVLEVALTATDANDNARTVERAYGIRKPA